VVSKYSQDSIWVEKELDSAITNRKMVLPIKLDNEPLNDLFRFYLNNVQMILYDVEREKLVEFMRQQIGKTVSCVEESDAACERENKKAVIRRHNALTVNKVPTECRFCKGHIQEISKGVFECLICGRENYDYYQTVKRYLEKKGAASALEIERATGVPRKTVEYFLKEGYLEISKLDSYRMSCVRCGRSIRTGVLCDQCRKM